MRAYHAIVAAAVATLVWYVVASIRRRARLPAYDGVVLVVGGRAVSGEQYARAREGCTHVCRCNFAVQHHAAGEPTTFFLNAPLYARAPRGERALLGLYARSDPEVVRAFARIVRAARRVDANDSQHATLRHNALLRAMGCPSRFTNYLRCGHACIMELVHAGVHARVVGFSSCRDDADNSTYYNGDGDAIYAHHASLEHVRNENDILCWLHERGRITLYHE